MSTDRLARRGVLLGLAGLVLVAATSLLVAVRAQQQTADLQQFDRAANCARLAQAEQFRRLAALTADPTDAERREQAEAFRQLAEALERVVQHPADSICQP